MIRPISLLLLLLSTTCCSAQTLCAPNEQVFFSCPVGKKVVSLCTTAEAMSYRFGTPKKIEMTYSGGAAERKFSRREAIGASNSAKIIWFTNNDIKYSLYSPARGGPMLEVEKDEKTLARMECKKGWTSTVGDIDQLSPFIREIAQ